MNLRDYTDILLRRKWLIILTTIITVAIVILGTRQMKPVYTAATTVRLATVLTGSVESARYNIQYADRLMNTYINIASSKAALVELTTQLELEEAPDVQAEILANTELIQISVEHESPEIAALAANRLTDILINQDRTLSSEIRTQTESVLLDQITSLDSELRLAQEQYDSLLTEHTASADVLAAAQEFIAIKRSTISTLMEQYQQARLREVLQSNSLSVIDIATAPEYPSSPNLILNIALGLLIGLAGGLGLAFLLENFDTTLYTTKKIQEITSLPIVGAIPTISKRRISTFLRENQVEAEAFRQLRTNVLARVKSQKQPHSLLITSAEANEGKSTVITNLALTIAQSGHRVVLIDADMRRPVLHEQFDLHNRIGLSSVLYSRVALSEALQATDMPGLTILSSGPTPERPDDLLGSAMFPALLEELKTQTELILIDTPALLSVSDASVLSLITQNVLLLVGQGQVRSEAVEQACQQLENIGACTMGVIVNRTKQLHTYRRDT